MSQRPLFQFAEVEAPRRPSPQRQRRERHADHRSGDLEIGKAAEHLVCYDLLLKGYNAFLSDQGLPYDIIVDLGSRILRVQVKGTRRPKNPMPGRAPAVLADALVPINRRSRPSRSSGP